MTNPLTYSATARRRLIGGAYALIGVFFVSAAMGAGASFYWDDDSGNGRWNTAINWVGDALPGNNDDIFFEDDYGTGAESVDLRGNRTVRSVNFDNPTAYTIDNRRFDFAAITGTIGINVDELNGAPASAIDHTINSTVRFQTELTVTNVTTDVTLAFGGTVNGRNSGDLTIEGGGAVRVDGNVRRVPTINVNDGTLQLGASNVIANSVDMNLGGGTFDTDGFNERVDTLTLSASSTIDMGAGASVLEFSDSSGVAWTGGAVLTVANWSGNLNGGGTDQLTFGNSSTDLTATQVAQIRFLNPAGLPAGTHAARILASGEIVPVPEPSTVIIGSLLVLVGLGDVYRRYRKSKVAKEEESELDEENA